MSEAQRDNSFDLAEFHHRRYNDVSAPSDERIASGKWLQDRGFLGSYGKQILPFGELPK